MKNDFEEISQEFLDKRYWTTVNYDFIKNWVGKTDGLITIDGVTLSVFNKPNLHYKLILWVGDNFTTEFEGGTLGMVVWSALSYLAGKNYEIYKETI